MKGTVFAALAISLAAAIVSTCGGTGGREEKSDGPVPMQENRHALHGKGCPPEHWCGSMNVIAPREFFDTGDLGSGEDGLYGGDDASFHFYRDHYRESPRGASGWRDRPPCRCPYWGDRYTRYPDIGVE